MKKIFTLILAACIMVPAIAQMNITEKVKNPNAPLPVVRKANAPAVKGDATIDITIVPDDYGSETTWELINTVSSSVVGSGGPYTDGNSDPINESFSVNSADCYTFIIYDAYGDGICCTYGNGSYTVEYNSTVVGSGGDFGAEDYVYGIGGGCPAEEISLLELTISEYGTPSEDIPVSGVVKNFGTDNLTQFDVTYNIDGGTDAATYTVSGISIPIGETYDFTHDVPATFASDGNYVINVTVSNPNGVADNTADNDMSHSIMINSNAVERVVLLENFTTAQCPNCPPAHTNLENWLSSQPKVIWLAHHAGYYTDEWTIPENSEMLVFYNSGASTYAPAIMLDRKFLAPDGDPGPVFFPASSYTPGLINDRVNTPSFVTLNIEGAYNENTRELNVDLTGTFHADFAEDLRLGLYIMEDGLEGSQAGVTGTYTHNHTMRDAISATFGDDVFSSTTADDTFSENYTYTLDSEWDYTNCTLVAWVSKWDGSDVNSREILQAAEKELTSIVSSPDVFDVEMDIYPNPTTGMLSVNNVEGAQVQVLNHLGQVVVNIDNANANNAIDLSEFSDGTYIVKIIMNDQVATRRIILTK